ncbi:MAG: Carboxylesterase NlhH [Anaerolineales bacterium]|nr:Carboxylesterase NlhH [Anaerolineales bacterium]
MRGHNVIKVLKVLLAGVVALIGVGLPVLAWTGPARLASVPEPREVLHTSRVAPQDWGTPVMGITTTYAIYKQDFAYGDAPFPITDMRSEGKYLDKESYDVHALTVYRAHDGQALLERRPVVFFVHGGAWIDGYRDWYEFVAHSFTGEMGWVTVVIDYRLTSDEVFIADQYCPDRDTCGRSENEPYRTKAGWYPDNIEGVAAAFRWVVEHIGENGGDAGEIVVFGHSAGGHLASLLATHPDYETRMRPAIRGLVTMSGAYELNSLNKVFWHDAVTQTFQGGFSNTELLEQASPAGYVVSGTRLPPFYILYAEDELLNLTEQNVMFKNQLQTLGFDIAAGYLAGYSHVTEMEAIGDADETPTQLIVNWIEAILGERVYVPLVVAR